MAHHASARKAMRQSLKRRTRNRQNLSRVKSQIKRLRTALGDGDAAAAMALLPATVSEIDRASKKGTVHDNTASRYKSRLSRRVNALVASGAQAPA